MDATNETTARVRELRAAYLRGVRGRWGANDAAWDVGDPTVVSDVDGQRRPASVEAERLYPMPIVTRPRVVSDPHNQNRFWRVENGEVQTRVHLGGTLAAWHAVNMVETCRGFVEHAPAPTLGRIRVWTDLLANPTEDVEAES